jgi:MFS family permease
VAGQPSLATGVSGPAPAAYAADVAPPGMNAAAMSTLRMLSDAGYVLGPLALGLITDLFGAGAALATATLLLTAVAVLFAPTPPRPSVLNRRSGGPDVAPTPSRARHAPTKPGRSSITRELLQR